MRTTPKSIIGETPLSFVYGSKAIIPTKVLLPTLKIWVNNEDNEENCSIDLILLEEKREKSNDKNGSSKKDHLEHIQQRCKTKKLQRGRPYTKKGPRQ